MELISSPPKVQVLVCSNERDPASRMPCCGGDGSAIHELLRVETLRRGWGMDCYITKTHCMAWCHTDGATVAIQPAGIWLRAVTTGDVPAILDELLAPMIAGRPVSHDVVQRIGSRDKS